MQKSLTIVKRISLILVLIILTSTVLFAQGRKLSSKSKKAVSHYEAAVKLYDAYKNKECLEEINKAIEADSNFIEAYFMLASVYTDLKQKTDAINAYQKAISIDEEFFPGALFTVANLQLSVGQYREAGINYQKYLRLDEGNPMKKRMAEKAMEAVAFALQQIAHPVPFNLVNMGGNVNSENDEYLPAITADEQTLIITVSNMAKQTFEDFYICHKVNNEWTKAQNMGAPLNTAGNEGAQCISPDGQYIYFTACNRDDGYGSCDIYSSHKIGDKWTLPENLGEPVNTTAWESQPSISADGKTLYFASARPGGKGGMDIWSSTQIAEGKWAVPVNLGDSINTINDDISPFIHPDNQTLYFSSNGRMGMGGKDIYFSRKNAKGNWGTPVNIGYPINTFADEINLVVNAKGDLAFYSSNKPGGYGKLDLYTFELYKDARPMAVNYMKGKVFDAESHQNLVARFELINLETGEVVTQSKSEAGSGEFLVCLPTGKEFALNVSRDGYLFYSEHISLSGTSSIMKPFLKDVPLKPIQIGESVVLNNIFFETDKFDLKPQSKVELNKLLALMKQNPGLKIEISGHTDNVGSEAHNISLSGSRARAVYDYLVTNGIAAARLTSKGYGWSKPVDTNDTEAGRANNRRTEFKVVGK
ncbi:MAG: OmpA family protein [Bacteroidetes bacterium]|nr:OmpA family protein [Bacteroidota bacterium]